MKIDKSIKSLIKQALKEDIGSGDITTKALIPSNTQAKAVIIAKQDGIIAGLGVAKAVFTQLDKNLQFKLSIRDGDAVKKGAIIAKINGSANAILVGERTALNFLGHLSGIATLTRQFVDKIRPYKARILDTRKTTPGLRVLEKYAVKCGGGTNHRMGLWDGALVKDNHIFIMRRGSCVVGLKNKITLEEIIKNLRRKSPKNISIEIEVRNLKELKDALNARPNIIMLDNMAFSQIEKAVSIKNNFLHMTHDTRHKTVLLEVSGGINLANVRRIAKAGVNRISIGALTHSAKALDFSLTI